MKKGLLTAAVVLVSFATGTSASLVYGGDWAINIDFGLPSAGDPLFTGQAYFYDHPGNDYWNDAEALGLMNPEPGSYGWTTPALLASDGVTDTGVQITRLPSVGGEPEGWYTHRSNMGGGDLLTDGLFTYGNTSGEPTTMTFVVYPIYDPYWVV